MTMDAEWLDLLLHLRVYLSPLQWTPYDWGAVVVQSVSIAIATDLLSGPARRVFAASFMVALGGLLAAILLGDMFVSLRAIQMQFWRTIWLLAALAPFAFALCVLRLGVEAARGWPGRVTLAALAFGWFSNPDIVVAVAVAVLALIAHFGIWTKKTPTKYLIALGAAMTGLTLFYTHTLIDFWHFLEKFPPVPALALYAMFRFSIAALPICLVAVMWVWAKPQFRTQWLTVSGGIGTAAAAALFWISLPPSANELESGRQPNAFASILDGHPGEVLWVGGSAESWYLLGRPQWASGLQPVSAVFSRPLAMLWRERARVLLDNGLAPRNIFEPRKQIDDSPILDVTRAALGSFCTREDAPVAIIFPLEKNKPLPAGLDAAIWTPPHSRYIADANDKMIWHVIDRYAGVPCRDKAESKKAPRRSYAPCSARRSAMSKIRTTRE